MGESKEQVTSFVLNHMKISDMRPKVEFKVMDLVRISGRHITGRIMAFDPDMRLAKVDSTLGTGWWYLKDLELESHAEAQRARRKPATINKEFDALFDDFHNSLFSPFQSNVVSVVNG